ncbi:Rv1733c family protein [Actinacidiphila sp. bgisy144]|uniref:Rv1733c family protein n=1 Tax=Actinacidiphila sp. bgisy144 TaxID=3413791 RepID=UPI003EB8E474
MRGRTTGTVRGWRWRRNPLRRRTDVVETWLALFFAVALCATPLLGWWADRSVGRVLSHEVATEHAERTLVTATLARDKASGSKTRPTEQLRWTGPDGSTRTATVSSDVEVLQQGRIKVWTDRAGRLAPPPLDSATAGTHAVLAGVAAGSAAAGLLVLSRQLLMWRLMLRRLESWAREWARVGQDWGRAGAGG